MATIHPFNRIKEFPNYFEIMLNSVPQEKQDDFVKKIQELIEQNINTIMKRLKLYYVNDKGELSTADYFNELVKSMEHVLKASPAKDDYNLEIYLSGGVVRALLGYVYRQLHINIQVVLEREREAAKTPKDKDEVFKTVLDELKISTEADQAKQKALDAVLTREAFLKTFTTTPEFWLQKLKTETSRLQNSYVLGVGSDMDILYKLSPRTFNHKSKLNDAQLKKLHEVLWHENALNNKQKKELYKAIKEQTLNEVQLKDLQKAIKNEYQLYEEELKDLQQAIEATRKLDKEQFDAPQSLALSDTEKTAREQYELRRQELKDLEKAIDNLYKLPGQALKESQELYETIKEKVQAAGDTFINNASNFLHLSGVEETTKNSLLPPGDVNEYTEQTKNSMLQGGSALDWLTIELSPKEGRKLIEPPSDLKQQAKMTQGIVESFIRGHYEYLDSQVEESAARRTTSVVRGLRPLFEIPCLKIKDETVILREMQSMGNLETRDEQGNIILPPRTLKQLTKLRRNTTFEGAHNRGTRPDPESPVLPTFLGITKKFAFARDGQMNAPLPKYIQSVTSLNKTPTTGQYQSEIDEALMSTEAFIDRYTESGSGTLYHGTPLEAVISIIRGGFFISDLDQGTAAYGSGLYTSQDRTVAARYGESVLSLHIDKHKSIKIIHLGTISSELLHDLEKEASEKGFLNEEGHVDVNALLRTQYNVDIIINTHVLIQNAAVIKPIRLNDMIEAYGAQFQQRYIKNIKIGEKFFPLLLAEEESVQEEASEFFSHYNNLCSLSIGFENDNLSPQKIINQLIQATQNENLDAAEKNLTTLFIYEHCFLAEPAYVHQHLQEIIGSVYINTSTPKIIDALKKFTQDFVAKLKKNDKKDPEVLVAFLKTFVLYANYRSLINAVLDELKPIGSEKLAAYFKELISSGEVSQAQALYFLAKIEDKKLIGEYLTFFALSKLSEVESMSNKLEEVGLFFTDYHQQYRLPGDFKNSGLSPATIINQLMKSLQNEHLDADDINTTKLFIYEHCFLAEAGHTNNHLREMIESANTNPRIREAFKKFTGNFVKKFEDNKTGNEELSTLLKLFVLYANNNALIIAVLDELKPLRPEKLSACFSNLIFSGEITQPQALYFLAKIQDEDPRNAYSILLGLSESEPKLEKYVWLRSLTIEDIFSMHPKEFFENMNMQDALGKTPLMFLCKTGSDKDIETTLTNKLDFNIAEKYGNTALQMAIKNDKITGACILKIIANHTIDVNYIFRFASQLTDTIKKSDFARKKLDLLLSNPQLNVPQTIEGQNILHFACRHGLHKTLQSLIVHHSDRFSLNQADDNQNTPLMLAIGSRQPETIKTLLALQATTKTLIDLDIRNHDGLSALEIAAQYGNQEIIDSLLAEKRNRGSAYNTNEISSALMLAVLNSTLNAAKSLIWAIPTQNLNNTYGEIFKKALFNVQFGILCEMVRKSDQPIDDTDDLLHTVYMDTLSKNNSLSEGATLLFHLMVEKKYKDKGAQALKRAVNKGNLEDVKKMCEQLEYSVKDLFLVLRRTRNKENITLYLLDHMLNKNISTKISLGQLDLEQMCQFIVEHNSIDVFKKLINSCTLSPEIIAKMPEHFREASKQPVVYHFQLEQQRTHKPKDNVPKDGGSDTQKPNR